MSQSKIIFSCGPSSKEKRRLPKRFYRKTSYGNTYYRLSAPLHVEFSGTLVKILGPVRFVAPGEVFWGGKNAKDFRSKVVEKPTYRAVLNAAIASQKKTLDYHHAFIEDCCFQGYEETKGRKVMILQLVFGS